MGFPLGFGSSLGLGCVTGQSGGRIVHMYASRQGVRVTRLSEPTAPSPFPREGTPRHSVLETPFESLRTGLDSAPASADLRQHERNGPPLIPVIVRCSPPQRAFSSAHPPKAGVPLSAGFRLGGSSTGGCFVCDSADNVNEMEALWAWQSCRYVWPR